MNENLNPIKTFYLYYYDELGFSRGLFRSNIFLTGMLILIFIGISCLSEAFLKDGVISYFIKDNNLVSSSRFITKSVAKLLAVVFAIACFFVLFFTSKGCYKKWISDFDQLTFTERNEYADKGKDASITITVVVLIFSIGSVFIMIDSFS